MPYGRGFQPAFQNRRSAPDHFLPIITQDFSPGTWAGTRRAPWEALCEPDTWHTHLQDHPGPRSPTYNKKLIIIPAATAEPITPETFGAIACINKWLLGSAFRPSCCTTRALS